jgi:hypothetical protein
MLAGKNSKMFEKYAPLIVLLMILAWVVCSRSKTSGYAPLAPSVEEAPKKTPAAPKKKCGAGVGVGLASSLLPRDVASDESFGQFAPDEVLKGQNFLDPRQQVGYPETIGGTLRNANQQIRTEPPNPKSAYVWSNSTIVPDLMRRPLN